MSAFAKYLYKDKFDMTVLTLEAQNAAPEEILFNCDVKRLPNKRFLKLPVFKSSDKKLLHYLKVGWKIILSKLHSDIYKSWRKEVVSELNQLHDKKKIDLVISSFSPEAAHIAACEFCEKKPSVKWIADMRDEMSQNPTISNHDKQKYIKIENRISKRVNAVTTVSQPLVDLFRNTTMSNVQFIEEIRNGFDHEILIAETKANPVFTFVYCGTFYGLHKPDLFFEAIIELEKENKILKDWRIIFVGTSQSIYIPETLKKNVSFIDRVSQQESLQYMMMADANLFMIGKSERVGVFTGKLFDYLSVGKPVLAIVNTEDVAAKLIIELNAGFVASNQNIVEVKEAILETLSKKQLTIDKNAVLKLHRSFQVEKLNLLIDKILNEK